jgi:serine/threonine-protein kinase
MKLEPGDAFGRYRIEAVLGQGGMGRVYRAYDTRLRRPVALKVLLVSGGRTETEARVLREARAAAALDHPEAVGIFDVGEAATPEGESVPYIAMELVVGRSVRVLAEDRALPLATRLRWLASVARVLAAAHRLGLVHRDIKPDNVLVRDDGAVRVLDFGLARQALDDETAHSPMARSQALTGEGVILGTPLYMSPEQLRGDTLDARTDQFSWGVMAYELVTGALPWKHKESVRVVAEILAVDPPPVRTIVPDVPADVAAVIEQALAKSPDDRLPSMDAVVEVLDAHARGDSAATTASAVARPRTRSRARAAFVLAGLVGAVGLGVVLWRARPAGDAVVALPGSASAPAPPSSAPIRLVDLPAPTSTSPEALAAYLEGVRGQHDGLNTAYRGLRRAVELDPSMAAANVRLLEIFVDARQYGMARRHYRNALAYGDKLTDRDRALCSAFEPGLVWDPVDWAESTRRLRALSQANPRDAYVHYLLGVLLINHGPSPGPRAEARSILEGVVAADPSFGMAWANLARLAIREGRHADARAIGEQCLREAPRATDCLDAMSTEDSIDGNCAGLLSDGRRWIAISPEDRWGYFEVASALAALGEPWDSVEEALTQATTRVAIEDREARGHQWRSALAALEGDFARADEAAEELGRSEALTFDPRDRAIILRVSLATERGDAAGAAALAGAYLRRRAAFSPPPLDTDTAPFLYAAQRRGGLLTPDALRTRMDRWRLDWRARLGGDLPPDAWTVGEARTVQSADEATQALATRPELRALSPGLDPGAVGRVSLLAGRFDEAESLLSAAAHGCNVFDAPFDVVRASLDLGLAREGRQDTVGACAAYHDVLVRWGSARPRSVTAEKARERALALRCPAVH